MSSWLLLFAALVFAGLAYDAWKLVVPAADAPYALTAEVLGQDVSGMPLEEQKKRHEWNTRYGIGSLRQTVWLWSILAVACAISSAVGFLT